MPFFLTSGEVSRRLRISVSTLKRWVKIGIVKPERRDFGGQRNWMLFSEEMIETLMKHRKKISKINLEA